MGTLKSFSVLLSLCFVFTYTAATADVFDGVLGNTASCHKTCQMTYSLHTYPREEELYACQRGCRLFSICQFVGDTEDLNQTKVECDSTCHEAYSQSDEQYACNLGCQSQLPFAERRQEQLLSMMPRIHLLYPLTLVRGFWDDVMSQAHSLISSSWTFYLQADDGKLVIFQTEPQIQFIPAFELQKEEVRGEPQKTCKSSLSYSVTSRLALRMVILGFSRRKVIVLTLFPEAVWNSVVSVATENRQFLHTSKLSIYGDMEYSKDHKLLTPYPASSLVIITSGQEEEAGPLPSKVNLDRSNI
uniref:Transmembrane protein 59 n=1 Tax=Hucho hucho TaxID=62062 RepID=A0A4W5L730_9TELE